MFVLSTLLCRFYIPWSFLGIQFSLSLSSWLVPFGIVPWVGGGGWGWSGVLWSSTRRATRVQQGNNNQQLSSVFVAALVRHASWCCRRSIAHGADVLVG